MLLWRSRHVLNPLQDVPPRDAHVDVTTETYQRLLMKRRDELVESTTVDNVFENTKAFRFLWSDYEPRCYWWDAYDASRRVFYVAVLAAVESGSSTQIFVGYVVSMLAAMLYGKFRPFVHTDDDFIAESAVHSVALTLLVALLRRADVVLTGQRGEQVAVGILFFAALLPFAAFCFAARSLVVQALGDVLAKVWTSSRREQPREAARIVPEPDSSLPQVEGHLVVLPRDDDDPTSRSEPPASPAGSETRLLDESNNSPPASP